MGNETLGILGVGHLASYTVKGLRNSGDQRGIVLSPRGSETARILAESCHCSIAADNQSVIDQSNILLLAVRPDALNSLLTGLRFKPGQIVISVMAGVTLPQLQAFPELTDTILVRALPSASAEACAGPIPLHPVNTKAADLFRRIGKVITLESEALFDVALSHACLHGWSYFLIQQIIDWSINQGMDQNTARQMVAHSIGSAVEFGEANPQLSYGEIGRSIATEGTFTRKGIDQIEASNGISSWVEAMNKILRQVKQ